MPAQPAAPTNNADTPSAASALPRERAATTVSNAHTATTATTAAPAQGPHVASQRSLPGCSSGLSTVIGTVSAGGTSRSSEPSVAWNDGSDSIGATSMSHSSVELPLGTAPVNIHRCAMRFAWANCPAKPSLPV